VCCDPRRFVSDQIKSIDLLRRLTTRALGHKMLKRDKNINIINKRKNKKDMDVWNRNVISVQILKKLRFGSEKVWFGSD